MRNQEFVGKLGSSKELVEIAREKKNEKVKEEYFIMELKLQDTF